MTATALGGALPGQGGCGNSRGLEGGGSSLQIPQGPACQPCKAGVALLGALALLDDRRLLTLDAARRDVSPAQLPGPFVHCGIFVLGLAACHCLWLPVPAPVISWLGPTGLCSMGRAYG